MGVKDGSLDLPTEDFRRSRKLGEQQMKWETSGKGTKSEVK